MRVRVPLFLITESLFNSFTIYENVVVKVWRTLSLFNCLADTIALMNG
jgi:ABC-type transporter Mla maintaining outer membrane lipid asymmetry ATPase subunit MlaF